MSLNLDWDLAMNELCRQAYLSALGLESYMPRWLLPEAPLPIACEMPVIPKVSVAVIESIKPLAKTDTNVEPAFSTDLLLDSLEHSNSKNKIDSSAVNAATILQQLEDIKPTIIQPFSLSVWRPQPGMLIVDERDTHSAFPTELLLGNILRTYLGGASFTLDEEVMRWPMIENRFVSRTIHDARNELQTWLAVENELRPVDCLWLMGKNAANYFLPENSIWDNYCWQKLGLDYLSIQTLILPSLNSILKQPSQKAGVWACL